MHIWKLILYNIDSLGEKRVEHVNMWGKGGLGQDLIPQNYGSLSSGKNTSKRNLQSSKTVNSQTNLTS